MVSFNGMLVKWPSFGLRTSEVSFRAPIRWIRLPEGRYSVSSKDILSLTKLSKHLTDGKHIARFFVRLPNQKKRIIDERKFFVFNFLNSRSSCRYEGSSCFHELIHPIEGWQHGVLKEFLGW